MKNIILLGSSGSIGTQTIDVIEHYPNDFNLVGVSVGNKVDYLEKLIIKHNLKYACVKNQADFLILQNKYINVTFFYGDDGLIQLLEICKEKTDIVVNALVGFAGLLPTIKAIELGKDIALANKESLVVAGDIITKLASEKKVNIIPVDSEHSAVFQCLKAERLEDVKNIWITASGGSLRDLTDKEIENVTVEQVLKHPNWQMGAKITVDSATLMNKVFEVIEAYHLFNIEPNKIKVIIQKESIIHSLVEYVDGAFLAHIGNPDMRHPIQYALTYPKRLPLLNAKPFDLTTLTTLNFAKPNDNKFKALKQIDKALTIKGSYPCVLNAANEMAVALFLDRKITFNDIMTLVEKTLASHKVVDNPTIEQLVTIDNDVRKNILERMGI